MVNFKIVTSVTVQLTVVGLYILGKMCIYVYNKCCKDPRAKKKAERRDLK